MKKKLVFSGVGTALITPFIKGEIDYSALGALIERQIKAGVGTLIIGGTTAEAATLSDGERYRMYSFAKGKIGGRARLILGTGTNDTRVAMAHTKFAERLGCDGALIVTPYYNKGTEDGVEKHYMSIAESVDLPIIVYNVPSRTGVNLGINLLSRLKEHPNIVGIKEASDSVDRLVELSSFGDELYLYAGNDSQIYPTLSLGGKGVISVVSNIYPAAVGELYKLYISGDLGGALRLQHRLLPLIRALFCETNPSPVKYAMSTLGLCRDELRLPLSPPRESTRSELIERLRQLDDLS